MERRGASVSAFKRERRMDRVRMRPPTVMCPHSSDTNMWHSAVGLLHVLREREREREGGKERETERERERSTNNAHWVLWGSSWWDVQWPKGELFRPGRGASRCTAFIRLEVDGWAAFNFVKHCNTVEGKVSPLTLPSNQGFQRVDGDDVNVW